MPEVCFICDREIKPEDLILYYGWWKKQPPKVHLFCYFNAKKFLDEEIPKARDEGLKQEYYDQFPKEDQ